MERILSSPGVVMVFLLASTGLVFLAVGRLDRLLPRGSLVETWVQRWSGAGQALTIGIAALLGIHVVYGGDALVWRWLTVGVFAAILWSVRQALSDWGNGVVLRSEGTVRQGARVGLDTASGRIRRLGMRSAELETEDGRFLRIPYTALTGAILEAGAEEKGVRAHTFSLEVPDDGEAGDLMRAVVTEALMSPWCSAHPAPTARLVERQEGRLRFEVTVHPIDSSNASMVEKAVRQGIAAAP